MVSAIFSGMPVFHWHQNYCHYTFVILFFICKVGAATQAVGLVAGLSFLYQGMQGGSGGEMCAGPIRYHPTKQYPLIKKGIKDCEILKAQ